MKSNNSTFSEKFTEQFKKIRMEMEELSLQLHLGKADAEDKFEELKKEFSQKTREWKQKFSELKVSGNEKVNGITAALEELQVQLALGKADAKDYFKEQKKKILEKIHQLESEAKSNPEVREHLDDWRNELEKFKLKLDILEMQFELKSMEGKDKLKNAFVDIELKFEKAMNKAEEQWKEVRNKTSDFNSEVTKSFEHLKKAVKSLRKTE